MRLKTLNDLPICPHCRGSVQGNHKCVHFYELKAEAVKYWKDIQEHIENTTKSKTGESAREVMYGTQHFIEHFFNLTKEDLR